MIRSMTGFGRAERTAEGWRCRAEVRSVNSRFLDPRLRLPTGMAAFEEGLKEQVKARCARGKLDCTLSLLPEEERADPYVLNAPLARNYGHLMAAFREQTGAAVSVSLQDLLGVKDLVLGRDWAEEAGAVEPLLHDTLAVALDDLVAMRQREGEATLADLRRRLAHLRALLERIGPLTRDVPDLYARRLRDSVARLSEAPPADTARLEQEIALFADRSDVSEELARFAAHLDGAEAMLAEGGVLGRKFEFLLQEMGREANTLSAKASHAGVSRLVIDVKAEIEKLREQIQNIE